MSRLLVTVSIVAGISGLVGHFDAAQGQREFSASRFDSSTWVRTVDGWESPDTLRPVPPIASLPTLHPLLVAGFQLSASLLALMAFPEVRSVGQRSKVPAVSV